MIEDYSPPNKLLLFAEIRAFGELAAGIAATPIIYTQAKLGDGHTVLVLPGFLTSDSSTIFIRNILRTLGYNAVGWEMGRNLGGVYNMRTKLKTLVEHLYSQNGGKKISIVGWSLGGVYARDLAINCPNMIEKIITLGSPFAGDIRANNVGRLYNMVSGESIDDVNLDDLKALSDHLTVPNSSIFSKTDGIVHWKTSLTKDHKLSENIEIIGASHLGLGFHPAVIWAVIDRLSQNSINFEKFDYSGPFSIAYRKPN